MSFHFVPGQFRIPKTPLFAPPDGVWRGADADEGLFAFDAGYSWGGRIMSKELCYSLSVDGSRLRPVFSSVNGYVHWTGGSGSVYYTQAYGWIYMGGMFPGYEPVEDYDYKDGEMKWTGDSFYSFTAFPGQGASATLAPRGAIRDSGEEKTLTPVWPRWKAKRGEFGEYAPADGAEGTRWLGLPRFRGGGEFFVRSFAKTDGHFTYGRIRNADGKWVIGEPGSDAGWHEGAEPSLEGAVTFRFTRKEGSEARGLDISVCLYDHVRGDERSRAYLGEVAIWR